MPVFLPSKRSPDLAGAFYRQGGERHREVVHERIVYNQIYRPAGSAFAGVIVIWAFSSRILLSLLPLQIDVVEHSG